MKKIKILHITQATIGGTLEYLKLFFSHIDSNKYEVCLICPSYGPMKKEIEDMGIYVYPIEMSRNISFKKDIACFLEIKKAISYIKPDIVHLHSSKAGVLGKLASYLNKSPCIYNAHGWSFSMDTSTLKKNIYALIEKVTSIFCDKVVNISNYEQELAIKYKVCKLDKMQVIYNGVDKTKHKLYYPKNELKSELKINEDAIIIGMVARITPQKDPIKFIEIAKLVCKKISNAHFILVGDGELKKEVLDLIDKYNLNKKVTITGWTNDVSKYINIFDIGVLTSKWEGFGLALAEYMCVPLPIVASNVGAIPELIDNNVNGFLVNVDDIDDYVDSIVKIILDDKLADKFKANSEKILNNKFSIENLVIEHENLYLEVLK